MSIYYLHVTLQALRIRRYGGVKKVLFVCGENSARSQMAEGFKPGAGDLDLMRRIRDDIRQRVSQLVRELGDDTDS